MLIFWFVLAALANYRLSRAVVREDGPFDLFAAWRDRVGQASWVGRGFHCVQCVSFWLAVPLALLAGPADWREALLLWGGVAGAATVLHLVIA